MNSKFNLEGKVAIITGASRGIGKEISKALGSAGAKLILSSRKEESLKILEQELKESGVEASSVACHVGDQAQLENLVNKTKEIYGGVDILVNNAATNPVFAPLSETQSEVFDKIINVNVKACVFLSNLCYPIMKERGGGSIINIASVEGIKPSFGLAIYSISKSALIMLTKNQAVEWGRDNIRSNAICPGLIKTKFSSAIWQNEDFLNKFTSRLPLNRMAEPDEISSLALFLASEASSYCTGSTFTADGGYLVAV